MAITPGTKLGAFEITGLLGKGGMGEVYRARDTKLGREVAIKVLSGQFASDPDMLARFEREAHSLARIDHPNIAAIYEVGRAVLEPEKRPPTPEEIIYGVRTGPPPAAAGVAGAVTVHFLVMQLVEGETLADRLQQGPLSIDEARRIFSQIGEGLEAAHERGIIHRDLKPANIKISADDRVKILDFGIAKSTEGHPAPGAPTPTPSNRIDPTAPTRPISTPSGPLTGEDMLIGTPQYMSPEQIRGKHIDRRSDIWAFGICLYQALTGRLPFDGEVVADVLSAVLRDDVVWDRLPSGTPTRIRNLIARCGGGINAIAPDGSNRRTLTQPDQLAGESAHVPVEVAPEGDAITIAVQRTTVWGDCKTEVLSLSTGHRVTLADPSVAGYLLSSGHFVYTLGENAFAARVSGSPPRVTGASAQVLDSVKLDAEEYLAQLAMSPGGTLVYAPDRFAQLKQPLYWVTRDGKRTEIRSNASYFAAPRVSPDGELIATVCADATGHLQVCIHDIRRGVLEWITRDSGDAVVPVWHPSSEKFVVTRTENYPAMYSYALDGGGFTKMHDNEVPEWPSSYSPDGRFLLFTRAPRAAVIEVWVMMEDGSSEPLVDAEAANFCPRFDASGAYFAYVSNESGRWEIYLKPFKKTGRRIQVSIDGGTDPVWAPDGTELFYRNGNTVMAVPIQHQQRIIVGQPKPLFDFPFGSKVSVYSPNFDIHPDGDRFVVTETTADTRGATELVVITNWCEELNRLLPPEPA